MYELITGQLENDTIIHYMIVKDEEIVKQGTSESLDEINEIFEPFKN